MAEILHRLIGSLSHYLYGFIHPRWCRISAINRTTQLLYKEYFINHFLRIPSNQEVWSFGDDILRGCNFLMKKKSPTWNDLKKQFKMDGCLVKQSFNGC